MLIDFTFKNFRAFRDEQVLSLVASKDKEYSQNIIKTEIGQDISLLRSVVLYGANASGKTTVLDALNFSKYLIRHSAKSKPDSRIRVKPFLLCEESRLKPIEFEYTFIQEEVRYQYGFIVTQKQVLEEWLISYPKGRARKLFSRQYNEDLKKSVYKFSAYLKGEKDKLVELTSSSALFLSVGATFNNKQLLTVYKWFDNKLIGVRAHNLNHRMFISEIKKPTFKEKVREVIQYADLGIVDFVVVEKDIKYSEALPDDAPESFIRLMDAFREWAKEEGEEPKEITVNMLHKFEDTAVPFSLEDESAGTQQLLSLSTPLLKALSEGHVLYVDELDSSLHPLLVRSIVSLFHDPIINKKGAQLIFNTHDTTLLNMSLFRRDQIWFIEKKQDGSSNIYSLLEFSPRIGEALEKGYLQGRFGGIPFIGELPREVFETG